MTEVRGRPGVDKLSHPAETLGRPRPHCQGIPTPRDTLRNSINLDWMPMPRDPLFHSRVLRERLSRHTFPPDLSEKREHLNPWIRDLRSGDLAQAKEVALHGPFFASVFGSALGYRTWATRAEDTWDLNQEETVGRHGGRSADGALGWFGRDQQGQIHTVIELKGAKQALDHAGGRVLTPVQQAWDYANRSRGCRWIIVSNFKETRLYSTARTPDEYAVFQLEDLEDLDEFRRFYVLLARENLLPSSPDRQSLVDDLLTASAQVQADITDALYRDYRKLRKEMFLRLRRAHSNRPPLEMLRHTQKLLDRLLFIAFAEDRGLLPARTIQHALAYSDFYESRPIWQNLLAVFKWVDEGNPSRGFPPYDGGLFAEDPEFESIEPDNDTCRLFEVIARYDFREDVSVEVLGHIFEQSISDLEEIRSEVQGEDAPALSKRKAEGVFYTPSFVTRHIVENTLGRTFEDRFQVALARHDPEKVRGSRKKEAAWIATWLDYREMLRSIRILDLACGSGAFLIAAFDALHAEYERVNAALADLHGGQADIWDLNKTILNANLFGVDLNHESVEITRLSLWLKTASPGNKLTWLDGNIQCGNSIVSAPAVAPRAFDWSAGRRVGTYLNPEESPEAVEVDARWREGFDVVIGNPPYVRQELLTGIKEHLKENFRAYHGVADIYVYFFERGLSLLKPGGRLGFIVSNKWLKGGYAAPLRGLLAAETEVETLIDFGHAPIFPDADAFPSIITMRKPAEGESLSAAHEVETTQFPREELRGSSVREYVSAHSISIPQTRFGSQTWSLEPPAVDALMSKMRERGTPLAEYAGVKPLRGIMTGLNEAFLIDGETRARILHEDPRSAELIHRYLRGQDLERWSPDWDGQYLIVLASSGDRDWPWKGMQEDRAEAVFRQYYPAFHTHFKVFEEKLRKRTDQGLYWWELRTCGHYDSFTQPKLMYQEIQFHPSNAIDDSGLFANNKVFMVPTADPWLLAVLNTPLIWWHNWRYLPHMKDEALTPSQVKMKVLPIAEPNGAARSMADEIVPQLVAHSQANHRSRRGMLDTLRLQYGVAKPGNALAEFGSLDGEAFVQDVVRRRPRAAGKLKPSDLVELRELHETESAQFLKRLQEIATWERTLSDLVNEAYGLTPEEIDLVKKTAPPRMPPGMGT